MKSISFLVSAFFFFKKNYLSRGGYKLEAAIEQLGVDVAGKVALDSGLSTGGFTDCLLQYGASLVYGVDVGYGQVVQLCLMATLIRLTSTELNKSAFSPLPLS